MYVLVQVVEKRLEVQGSVALRFVDLDKSFDTVPREMVMATLRWMGVPEAEGHIRDYPCCLSSIMRDYRPFVIH